MAHSNSTTNYQLPQFANTDKGQWLGDLNPAFLAIDTGMFENKTNIDKNIVDISEAKEMATTANQSATTANASASNAINTSNEAKQLAENLQIQVNNISSTTNSIADYVVSVTEESLTYVSKKWGESVWNTQGNTNCKVYRWNSGRVQIYMKEAVTCTITASTSADFGIKLPTTSFPNFTGKYYSFNSVGYLGTGNGYQVRPDFVDKIADGYIIRATYYSDGNSLQTRLVVKANIELLE